MRQAPHLLSFELVLLEQNPTGLPHRSMPPYNGGELVSYPLRRGGRCFKRVGLCLQEAQLGVDKIIDALDLMETEEERKFEPGYQPNVMLLGMSGSQYLLRAVSSIRANDLDTACVSLSFSDALTLLKMVPAWIEDPLNVRLGASCLCVDL